MVKALRFSRNESKYAAAMIAARFRPGAGGTVGPLSLIDDAAPDLPTEDWVRVWPRLAGICGSDLSTIDGHASRYFEDFVSFPFVPGHEVVADTADGRRVVLEPVLGHTCRGFEPPFEGASPADGNDYRHLTCGHLEPGLQTGFCESTGGGWSTEFVAHPSQLHDVPDWMSDELAVTIEPVAGGVHAALRANVKDGETVAVIGAGAMGLVTVAALRHFTNPDSIMIGAKYPVQKDLAAEFGADVVCAPGELARAVRRSTGSFMVGPRLSGGADVVIDAVGSQESIESAISMCRPRGRVVLLGMPGVVELDLTALWHRETELIGTYTYGTETLPDGRIASAFALALELAGKVPFDRLVSATYPLIRYREALVHAAEAGSRGAVKVAFDMRGEKRRGIPAVES
ncbi:MAG: zinc-binding dehydrogenase [Acidimicrobiaceae bacterium]|nr:zinc-binding dehydrogenase [Acidimicrobiaceae bacterium]